MKDSRFARGELNELEEIASDLLRYGSEGKQEYERGHRDGVIAATLGHDDIVTALENEITRLNELAFLLCCHPEDARKVAREMLTPGSYNCDRYGHLTKRQETP